MFSKAMSEFTYACPVCGQHIKCDSSQAGTVMECPTCFQKIIVPQAPATADSKFILTGTKVGERPMPKVAEAAPEPRRPARGFPVGALLVVLLLCGAAAAVIVLRGRIFPVTTPVAPTNQVANPSNEAPADTTPKAKRPPPPMASAPPSSDTNWMLNLATAEFPDGPVAGRIHGRDFIAQRVVLQNGTLMFREGRAGPLTFAVQISFGGNAQAETLAGQALKIATNALVAAQVTMLWPDGDEIDREELQGNYAMRLSFGAVNGNRLPGKIYFCAPDQMKSYLAGTFNAEIRRPRRR